MSINSSPFPILDLGTKGDSNLKVGSVFPVHVLALTMFAILRNKPALVAEIH